MGLPLSHRAHGEIWDWPITIPPEVASDPSNIDVNEWRVARFSAGGIETHRRDVFIGTLEGEGASP